MNGAESGERAYKLQRRREREESAFKQRVQSATQAAGSSKLVGFAAPGSSAEQESAFQQATVGLNSREAWRKEREESAARVRQSKHYEEAERERAAEARFMKRTKKNAPKLSFLDEADMHLEADGDKTHMSTEEQEREGRVPLSAELSLAAASKRKKPGKDPTADTRFLPDPQREEEEEQEKERLRREYERIREQDEKKQVELLVTFWGQGGGRRRNIVVRKGDTIHTLVRIAKERLSREHKDLNAASSHNVLCVRDDVILPHRFKLYDIEARNVTGRSGKPLLTCSTADNGKRCRDESGGVWKLIVRATYERFKHQYPQCTWTELKDLNSTPS